VHDSTPHDGAQALGRQARRWLKGMQWSTHQSDRNQLPSCARYFGRCSWPSQ